MQNIFLKFKDFFAKLAESHHLVLHILDGLGKIPSFAKGMSKERGTKQWIKESTPQHINANKGKAVSRKAEAHKSRKHGGKLRLSEFGRFAKIVSWIIGNKALYGYFHEFLLRVEQMLIRNGSNYTFKYMKECLRLAVRALAGSPEVGTNYQPGDIRVRRDSFGIPTILPLSLRLVLHAYIINADKPLMMEGYDPELDPMSNYINQGPLNPKWNQRNIVGVLTIMTVFRVFATKVEPTLGTIIKPFNGVVDSFNPELIHKALCLMCSKVERRTVFDFATGGNKTLMKYHAGESPNLTMGNFVPHVSVKAGPNGSFSTWSASLDALAFLHEPSKFVALLRWMYIQKSYRWIAIFCLINFLFGPIYGLFYSFQRSFDFLASLVAPHPKLYYAIKPYFNWVGLFRIAIGGPQHERDKLYLGKLGVVYDQAGKARVVASANWWIQSALHGLHDSIFSVLKTLPKDGTMDQNAAFDNLITNVTKESKLSGFDLSAATDRLPITLQKVVLDSCGINGSLWKELMDVTYVAPFDNKENLTEVKYAVGQPMGAYSSWAMLALTHHVIVNLSAILAGLDKTDVNYAILGDDIVINNDVVAEGYLALMSDLGLEISMGKSVISNRFTEFAKKLRGPGVDFSPIGAGAVLAASRSGLMFPQLFLSAVGNVITSPEEILDRLKDFPSALVSRHQAAGYLSIVLWQLFGPSSPLVKMNPVNFGRLVTDMLEFVPGIPKGGMLFEHLKDSMNTLFTKRIRGQIALSEMPMKHFILNAFILVVSGSPVLRVLETLMKPFNPGFWIYLDAAFTAPFKLNSYWEEVYSQFPSYDSPGISGGGDGYFRARAIMRILSQNTPELSPLTLDLSKKELATRAKYLADIRADMKSRHDLSFQFHWPTGLHTRWYELEGYIPRRQEESN